MKQNILNASVSGLGIIASVLFGGWSNLLTLFFTVLLLDYLTGIFASLIDGKGLSSSYGYRGLLKKFSIVLIIVLSKMFDDVAGTDIIMTGALYFFIANEMISIIENYGRMGLPLPPQIKNIISILKEKK